MDKSLVLALPKKRPYTLIEAVFSYQLDLDNGSIKGFREYSRMWSWSLKKTIGFIRNTQGTKTEQARNTQETVKFRFIKPLQGSKKQARVKWETKGDHAGNTTIDPDAILDPKLTDTTIPEPKRSWLEILSTIPNYPFNSEQDLAFLLAKEKDYPSIDITSLLKGWKSYLLDKPLNGKSRPRSQLHNQFELAMKWGKYQQKKDGHNGGLRSDVGDRIDAAERAMPEERVNA